MSRPTASRGDRTLPNENTAQGAAVVPEAVAALQAVRLPEQARVRLAAVSLREGEEPQRALDRALGLAFDGFSGLRIALLPGTQDQWPAAPRNVTDLARAHGTWALFESCTPEDSSRAYLACDPSGRLTAPPIRQLFATSGEAAEEDRVRRLVLACAPGQTRTLYLGGVPIRLLICGENNILYNEQSAGNRVSVRHGLAAALFEHVPVIFNGAHTNLGNWGKLERRFEFSSRDGRFVLFATNNSNGSWRGAVRLYPDGARVADGENTVRESKGACVRLHADPDDRFRAITLEVEGMRLQGRASP